MSLIETFMELDRLYEATMNRQACIELLRASGKNYNFDKYSDAQIFRMWEKEEKEKADNGLASNIHAGKPTCDECGSRLTDGGLCPVCDDGEEDI